MHVRLVAPSGNKEAMARALVALAAFIAAGCGVADHPARGPEPERDAGWIVAAAATVDRAGSHWGYFAVRPDGSDLRRLAFPEEGPGADLAFSADGRLAALSLVRPDNESDRGSDIVVSPADLWKPRNIPLARDAASPSLSPDGKWLALAYDPGLTSLTRSDLWLVSVDGRDLRRIAATGGVTHTAWSPQGSWIAFADERAARQIEGAVIYLVRPDGTDLHRLTGEFASKRPAWSPDGTQLALEDLEGRVVIVGRDGDGKRVLTAGGGEGAPAWSPDGNWIAFARSVPTDSEGVYAVGFFVIPAGGGSADRIASFDAGDDEPLSWTQVQPASSPAP
jgi:Tol biopolymer transport system component